MKTIEPANRTGKGFTLLELIVVLIILAALATIGMQIFSNKGGTARQLAHNANVDILKKQASAYLLSKDIKPSNGEELIDDLLNNGYIKEIPTNPITGQKEYSIKYDESTGKATIEPDKVEVTGIVNKGLTLTITASTGDSTTEESIIYTFKFSEAVIDFEESDIEITNGAAGTFTKISDTEYTLVVGNSGTCIQTITVQNGACKTADNKENKIAIKTISITDVTAPLAPTFNANPTVITNSDVTVTITYPADAATREYKTQSEDTWKAYTGAIVLTENDTIYARAIDLAGNVSTESSITVSNIDKDAPLAPTFEVSTTMPTNADVTVTIIYAYDVDVKQYKIGIGGVWENYTGPIIVANNENIYARGIDTAGNESFESSISITNIDKDPPTIPTLTPSTTFPTNGNVTVTITYPDDATTREYKLGAAGTWTSYTGPVGVSSNDTVYARGTDAAGNTSTESTLVITNIDKVAPTAPTANVASGLYNSDRSVILSGEAGATIRYTTNGVDPTTASTVYSSAITISTTTTLKAVQWDAAGNASPVATYTYTIDKVAPTTPTFSISPSTWTNGNVTVTITYPADADARHYKIGAGGAWTNYTAPVVLTDNNSVYARGIDLAGNISVEGTGSVTNIDKTAPVAPTANVASGTYAVVQNVTLSGEAGATIRYTLDGTNPTTASTAYSSAIVINTSRTLKAIQWDAAGNASPVATFAYTVNISVANIPKLSTGMTAMNFNGTTFVDATAAEITNRTWYSYRADYDQSVADRVAYEKWANARLADGSLFVWIPRYTYKITKNGVNSKIEIKYSNGTTDDTTNGFLSHPAFNFGGAQLTGIWVAKFEASNNASKVQSKPAVITWQSMTGSQAFDYCRQMQTTYSSTFGISTNTAVIDTHLMKNSEWAAVAYLTEAIRDGDEVGVKIGSESDTSSTFFYSGSATTVATVYTNAANIETSTTGNAYGVYDLNGEREIVASYIGAGDSTYNSSIISAAAKYKDVISGATTDDGLTNYNATAGQTNGLGLHEVASGHNGSSTFRGYNDCQIFPYSSNPDFERGGSAMNGNSGIFAYGSSINFGKTRVTFRPTIVVF